ncbi:hypothetical protein [Bosea vaviloviae]|uniref:Uncharacterized protein n=1 Tax=Bosea vaviloviae TaxID=1526658 RepID=A0A0N1F3S3_9HYPH|nr:hypothetical protein [Bosea vaviloviae]KPH80558.1 hypothetical protein AE618_12355 [Bosea vaviloviae]
MDADADHLSRQALREQAAIRAAARAFHEAAREKHQFTWETASPAWRAEVKAFVRPLIVAGLAAADQFDAATERALKADSA